ncbi:hypothetical protein Cfor_03530 [Coptotermes formosanus]|uniref:Uncharacterized protein n=1 Tax=Coptotermes formosanus TaxID=36987 RepID=A0A6L2PQL8_COPFO|nr:hypothetical protein Cfor_03530 [Coptotermes formosanus]
MAPAVIQSVSKVALQLDIREQFLFPQFGEDDHEGRMYFQQHGAPAHCHRDVRKCLNTRFPGRWMGRVARI